MFCISIFLFGSVFLGLLGYLVQSEMPFLKFHMNDPHVTQNSLYISSLIYFIIFFMLVCYECCKNKEFPQYRIYQQWKYEIHE